jgi:hypothetical protein
MKKVYDGEAELVKARLGLKFRCAICGKQHNPVKGEWRRCLQNVDIYQLFQSGDYDLSAWVPSVAPLLKGEAAVKRARKYYITHLRIWESEFELLTIPRKVRMKYRRAVQLERAFEKVLMEWCKKPPYIPLSVERIYESNSRIDLLSVNGKLLLAYEVLELFHCPTGEWDRSRSEDEEKFCRAKYYLLGVDRRLRCAYVERISTEYWDPKELKPQYYLVFWDRFVEVQRDEVQKGIFTWGDQPGAGEAFFGASSSPPHFKT